MSKELRILNFLCVLVALGFLAIAVISAISSGDFLTTDNLFIITVCLVMALLFAINPLLYMRSQGKLPLPFIGRKTAPAVTGGNSSAAVAGGANWASLRSHTPPLLDAKGRAVPPDVKAMVSRMNQAEAKDA
ncbi:MAG TPA: hypothetical protein VFZ22_03600 [Pyrinomonadaceae bacterium]|nr:hypothetical protein [Pyrinomonadaceae bacterium]